jgi:hypothetical protein
MKFEPIAGDFSPMSRERFIQEFVLRHGVVCVHESDAGDASLRRIVKFADTLFAIIYGPRGK